MEWQTALLYGAMLFALYTADKARRPKQSGQAPRRPGTAARKNQAAATRPEDRMGRALDNLTKYDGTGARQEEMEDVHEQWDQG